ncbi:MAG: CvpA family protein [Bacteroidales bacterium]|jgi:membrane protein required for colicin V production|nr:CvpA family protein [Bacteroidales bacterium]
MVTLDIILLLCFIPGIVSGISKGFVKQLASLAAIILGAWAAFRFSEMLSAWLQTKLTMDPKLVYVISFAIIVVLAVLLLNLIGNLIVNALKVADLGWLDRVLGFFLGIFKAALILGLLIFIFDGINEKWHLVDPAKFENAAVYNALRDVSRAVFPAIKSFMTGTPPDPAEIVNA